MDDYTKRLTDEEIQEWFDTITDREHCRENTSIAVVDLMRALTELRRLRDAVTRIAGAMDAENSPHDPNEATVSMILENL